MKAVILAAGLGSRMYPLTNGAPKPLVRVNGKTLLEHLLINLKKAGLTDCIIVTGYKGDVIQKTIGDGSKYGVKIQYCHNPNYRDGNGVSLLTAGKVLENSKEPFMLLMSDHLVDMNLISEALLNVKNNPLLCVDYTPEFKPQLKDATKVLVDENNYVIRIGKQLKKWNGVDTGVFILNPDVFPILKDLYIQKGKVTITDLVRYLSNNETPLWACDVSNYTWFDVDTPEDVQFVEQIIDGERVANA